MSGLIGADGEPLVHPERCVCDACILTWDETPDEYVERITDGMDDDQRARFKANAAFVYASAEYGVLTRRRAAYRAAGGADGSEQP